MPSAVAARLPIFALICPLLYGADVLRSPDGRISVRVDIEAGQPKWSVDFQGRPLIVKGLLGVEATPAFSGTWKAAGRSRSQVDTSWRAVWGNRSVVPDRHNELKVALRDARSGRGMDLRFRAYNEGVALRYEFSGQHSTEEISIGKRLTEYRFAGNYVVYQPRKYEYGTVRVESMSRSEGAVTVDAGGFFAALTDADRADFSMTSYAPAKDRPNTLTGVMTGPASGRLPFRTSWEAIIVGESLGRLYENRYLIENLNPPSAIADTSWIRAGKAISQIRNGRMVDQDMRKLLDFASAHRFDYMEIDHSWYGAETKWTAEEIAFFEKNHQPFWDDKPEWRNNVGGNPYTTAKGWVPFRPQAKSGGNIVDLDLPALAAYGKRLNPPVGVCVYLRAAVLKEFGGEHAIDDVLAAYAKMGLAGIKAGFIPNGTQYNERTIAFLVRKAAEHKLIVNIHDGYHPSGLSRTWPNLMNIEGGAGEEAEPSINPRIRSLHDVMLTFTRFLMGPFDYTPEIGKNRKTDCHQAAMAGVWFGRPTIRGGMKQWSPGGENTGGELEFIEKVPVLSDEIKVSAVANESVTVARRRGGDWYVASMSGINASSYDYPLTFQAWNAVPGHDFLRRSGVAAGSPHTGHGHVGHTRCHPNGTQRRPSHGPGADIQMRLSQALLAVAAMVTLAAAESRVRETFDFDWKFAPQDAVGAERPEFRDADWQTVHLPHDFSIYGPFDQKAPGGGPNGFRPLGTGWYRKSFRTPEHGSGRVFLEFEGIYRAPRVWVNGVLVAEYLNGYRGFTCDITQHLKPAGETNVVAVRADNSHPNTSRWYTGGGIYRHVWLTIAGEVHVASNGTWVSTPKIEPSAALVHVQTDLKNEGRELRWATLISEIHDPGGKVAATAKSVIPIRAGETLTVRQQTSVPAPALWSMAKPNLYSLVSRVSTAAGETDLYRTTFGIREVRITPDGLFLNGKREFLKGFNIHHDMGALGAAAFDTIIERRLRTMQQMGVNALRLAHNPHAPAVLDIADRLGILVYDEAFDVRDDQFYVVKGGFKANWAADLEWFIRRDRNHPSVFIWSVGNEGKDIFQAPDYGVNQSAAMADLVRRLDPTRPVTQALFPMRQDGVRQGIEKQVPNWREYPPHQVAFHMDVMSANYMEAFFAKDRLKYPQLSFISSESNVGGGGRGAWQALDREHAVGIFYWGGMDYIGESHFWPEKSRSAGYVSRTGWRSPWSFDLQSFFSEKPTLSLVVDHAPSTRYMGDGRRKVSMTNLVRHWNFSPDEKLKVEAYTNLDEVELMLNGRSIGAKRREGEPGAGPRLVWDIPFAPGRLVAIGRKGGKEVARDELRTAGEPAAMRLVPDVKTLRADGQDFAEITVEIVDRNGIVAPAATHLVRFNVSGPGVNAGVDNTDNLSDELFQDSRRSVFQGRAQLLVRSTREPGTVTVIAEADGLPVARLELHSQR